MRKVIALAAIVLLVGSLGAAVETGNNERVNIIRDKHVACCDDDGDGIGDMISELATGIEKEDLKRGMVIAPVASKQDGNTAKFDKNYGLVHNTDDCDDTRDAVPSRCVALTINEEGVEEEAGGTERAGRKGRNPQTGKEIKIPANNGGNSDSDVPREEVVLTAVIEHLNSIQDQVTFGLKEGRKGMNAVNVKVT